VMPVGDHDHIGCFTDQVKLTRALVRDLDEAIKEVNLLGEHEEESSQKIIELEALCMRMMEDAQKLREGMTTLEGMIQSRDELILEMTEEYGLNRMRENDDEVDEDDDDEGNAIAPLAPTLAAVPEEIVEEEAPWRMVHRSWMIWITWVIWMRISMKAALMWTSGFPKMGVMIEIESSSLSL
jgi:hypothetical protein